MQDAVLAKIMLQYAIDVLFLTTNTVKSKHRTSA